MNISIEHMSFYDEIKAKTGKDFIKGDYGFVVGSHSPLSGVGKAATSYELDGYRIWTYGPDGAGVTKQIDSATISDLTPQGHINIICEFLNRYPNAKS